MSQQHFGVSQCDRSELRSLIDEQYIIIGFPLYQPSLMGKRIYFLMFVFSEWPHDHSSTSIDCSALPIVIASFIIKLPFLRSAQAVLPWWVRGCCVGSSLFDLLSCVLSWPADPLSRFFSCGYIHGTSGLPGR